MKNIIIKIKNTLINLSSVLFGHRHSFFSTVEKKKHGLSFALIFIGILVGILVGKIFSSPLIEDSSHVSIEQSSSESQEQKVLYWYDPMYPATKFDAPGKSPFMDMDLIPRYAEEKGNMGIHIDPALVQNLAVKTVPARMGKLSFSRDIPGNVEFNDYHFAKVQPRIDGFVEKTYALAVGDRVQEGQVLVDITVPGWASDQSEYLLLRANNASAKLLHGVRERLRLAGMPEDLLKRVDKTGKVQTVLSITAPISGVLTAFDVYKGMNVNTGQTLASIQGVDPIWVTADVPESLIHLLRDGQKRIRVKVSAYPDHVFYSSQYTLLPQGNSGTRTIPLRLSLPNTEGILRPGMTASIRLRGTSEQTIIVPTRSIVDLGSEQRVIIRTSNGAFVPRSVKVSRQSREEVSISSGINIGDEVVVTGLFLIDSEANLSGALDKMQGKVTSSPLQEKKQAEKITSKTNDTKISDSMNSMSNNDPMEKRSMSDVSIQDVKDYD